MSFVQEFKDFALKGNVADMAIGVVIGGAFGKIVTSMVNNIIMPPLGLLMGKVDFSNLFINLSSHHVTTVAEAQKLGVPVLSYGLFLNSVLDFIIIAMAIFIVIKQLNRFKTPACEVPADTKECPFCMTSINIKAVRCPSCTSELPAQEAISN